MQGQFDLTIDQDEKPVYRPERFAETKDLIRAVGSTIWYAVLAVILGFASFGVLGAGKELGEPVGWVHGCSVFAQPRDCADAQEVLGLRGIVDIPTKTLTKEEVTAQREARIAELCKGLPSMLGHHAGCHE